METFAQRVINSAQQTPLRLLLPEGNDPRVLIAAQEIMHLKIASEVSVLGNPDQLQKIAKANNIDLKNINIIDFQSDPKLEEFAHEYYEQRKHKGMTEEQALKEMTDDVFFGAKMLSKNFSDAMVSGSFSPTSKTLRAAIFFAKPISKTISGTMVMEVSNKSLGTNGCLVFGDCAVVPKPTAEQLADIAIGSAQCARELLKIEPKVAMLSFSTLGSAKSSETEIVVEACDILHSRGVDFDFEGEIQLDAAIDPETASLKAPNSLVAGKANVLIFPNLGAANIGYKLVQRFSDKAQAFGPLLQGLTLPINDLSRGCFAEDIVITSAITLNQAIAKK
ncbi:MAG: phosphate acetyltransferase [Spirochaetota bacterium]|nr:phosphate acetyltransferase [Spirochaetota bacterium]